MGYESWYPGGVPCPTRSACGLRGLDSGWFPGKAETRGTLWNPLCGVRGVRGLRPIRSRPGTWSRRRRTINYHGQLACQWNRVNGIGSLKCQVRGWHRPVPRPGSGAFSATAKRRRADRKPTTPPLKVLDLKGVGCKPSILVLEADKPKLPSGLGDEVPPL